MAAKGYWAWAPITIANAVNGGTTAIPEGTKVLKSDLKDDWDNLLLSGVVRPVEYPNNVKTFESPNTTVLRTAREAMEAAMAPFRPSSLSEDEEEGVSVANG